MWVWWVDSYGTIYPRGFEATWVRIRELIDVEEDMEYSHVVRLETLLASPSSPISTSTGSVNSVIRGPPDGSSSNDIE